MILYAVYVIDFSGRPLIWQVFQSPDTLPKDGLLSPLLTSIQFLSEEVTHEAGAAEKFQMKGITYHLKNFHNFMVVLVTNNEKKPSEILNKLGWRFMKEYGSDLKTWDGNINKFDGFLDSLIDIVSHNFDIDFSQSIIPSKKLNPTELFRISKDLKETAYAITALKSASIEQVAKESGEELITVAENLEKLKDMGYLGTKEENDQIYYFY